MSNYTVVTTIYNEPIRIIPLLENFKHIENLIVLMDPADTQSEPVLIKNGVNYVKRPVGYNSFSESEKVEWILKHINTDYFLIAYASMFFTKSLLNQFELVSKENKYDGIKTSMVYLSHGKIVQRPFLIKKATACYFYRKSSIRAELAQIHDEFKLSSESIYLFLKPNLENSIHVYRDDDMPIITSKHIGYAKREAKEFIVNYNQSKMTYGKILYTTFKSFLSGYFRMGGFLAGTEGLLYHFNFAIYKYLVYSHIWELQNNRTFTINRINHTNDRLKQLGIKQQFNHE